MRLVGARSGVAQEVLVLSDILTKVNLTPALPTRVHLMALAPPPPASF